MSLLPRPFYERDTVEVARDLLGKILVRKIRGVKISGIICETEAYRYKDDPASHSFRGRTERNKVMFGEAGMAYVYFTYGMHYCVNAVARSRKYDAGAVLMRALIPLKGVGFMMKQRNTTVASNLANGPAKLTQALNITKNQYGVDLTKLSQLYITEGVEVKNSYIEVGPRVGIKKATKNLWNFKIKKEILATY